MSRKKMMAFSIVVSVFLITVSLFFSGQVKTPSAVLPTVSLPGAGTTPSGSYLGDVKTLEITTDNVQAVIEYLSRPASYSQGIFLDTYLEQGKVSYQVMVWVKDKVFKTSASRLGGSQVLNTIVTEDYVYIWYGDGPDYRRLKLGQDSPEQVADEYQKIPTYEDILLLDKEDILEAGYADYEGEPCIYVKAETGLMGYTYEYYVSARTGLLVLAETYDGEKLIHSTTAGSPNLSEPSDDAFRLPDGSSALTS
jgi:hypothetical protein